MFTDEPESYVRSVRSTVINTVILLAVADAITDKSPCCTCIVTEHWVVNARIWLATHVSHSWHINWCRHWCAHEQIETSACNKGEKSQRWDKQTDTGKDSLFSL